MQHHQRGMLDRDTGSSSQVAHRSVDLVEQAAIVDLWCEDPTPTSPSQYEHALHSSSLKAL